MSNSILHPWFSFWHLLLYSKVILGMDTYFRGKSWLVCSKIMAQSPLPMIDLKFPELRQLMQGILLVTFIDGDVDMVTKWIQSKTEMKSFIPQLGEFFLFPCCSKQEKKSSLGCHLNRLLPYFWLLLAAILVGWSWYCEEQNKIMEETNQPWICCDLFF